MKWNYPISIKGGFTLANAKLQCLDASRVREVEEIRWTDLEGATIREQRWRWRLRGTKREMEMKIESVAEMEMAIERNQKRDGDENWECSRERWRCELKRQRLRRRLRVQRLRRQVLHLRAFWLREGTCFHPRVLEKRKWT